MLPRSKYFKPEVFLKIPEIKETRVHNHLINNYVVGNKKALFHTMLAYYNETNQ